MPISFAKLSLQHKWPYIQKKFLILYPDAVVTRMYTQGEKLSP